MWGWSTVVPSAYRGEGRWCPLCPHEHRSNQWVRNIPLVIVHQSSALPNSTFLEAGLHWPYLHGESKRETSTPIGTKLLLSSVTSVSLPPAALPRTMEKHVSVSGSDMEFFNSTDHLMFKTETAVGERPQRGLLEESGRTCRLLFTYSVFLAVSVWADRVAPVSRMCLFCPQHWKGPKMSCLVSFQG